MANTAQQNVIVARDALAVELAAVCTNPAPTYNLNGRTVDWNSYRQHLRTEINELNKTIALMDQGGGDWEVYSQGFTG